MTKISDFIFSLLTSGKYRGVQNDKDIDGIIRLIVLNITYTITGILIAGIGVTDMRNGFVDLGLIELIIGSLIFLNLMLLRTELPFKVGAFIIIALYGVYCAISLFTRGEMDWAGRLWIY